MKQLIFILMFIISPSLLSAQPNPQPKDGPRFDPQKFQQMVEKELTTAGSLTQEEAKAFFPLYTEMRDKQRELGRQIHVLKTSTPSDSKAYAETITLIKKLQVEMAEMEMNYYRRFLKIVPAEKLFKMMRAEDEFHRRMVRGTHSKRKRPANEGQHR